MSLSPQKEFDRLRRLETLIHKCEEIKLALNSIKREGSSNIDLSRIYNNPPLTPQPRWNDAFQLVDECKRAMLLEYAELAMRRLERLDKDVDNAQNHVHVDPSC